MRSGGQTLGYACLAAGVASKLIDFEAAGGIPNDGEVATCWKNGALLNTTFAAMEPGDELVRTWNHVGQIQF
jgi:hypothetical protein